MKLYFYKALNFLIFTTSYKPKQNEGGLGKAS